MGWEKRNGNYYYYRKEREGNRVSSKYMGRGELADLISQLDGYDKIGKRVEAKRQRKERQKFEQIDLEIKGIENQIKALVESFLIENGFYKTSSRQWRLRGNYGKEKG